MCSRARRRPSCRARFCAAYDTRPNAPPTPRSTRTTRPMVLRSSTGAARSAGTLTACSHATRPTKSACTRRHAPLRLLGGGAPVGLMFHHRPVMRTGSWLDYGIFLEPSWSRPAHAARHLPRSCVTSSTASSARTSRTADEQLSAACRSACDPSAVGTRSSPNASRSCVTRNFLE